ncbi:hypothetical protein EZV62_003759 [Acer yangbiense]|uniref:TauD/TfdA-like domain-containing protein n=1 Tax=Acer yangbiense TaxID=1000413 RepID=A0A5C7IIS5_9ROSI|nr:hypothetical protein EZV62_003759 [Acer yangbiense]
MADHFTEIQIPQQKHYNSIPFPSVLSPNPTTTAVSCSVSHLIEAVKTQKPFLDSLLHKTGAVIFRGFDVKTPEDFNDVVEAFGYEELSYVGGTAPRSNIVGRVFTANESPPDQHIGFHHEMAMMVELFSLSEDGFGSAFAIGRMVELLSLSEDGFGSAFVDGRVAPEPPSKLFFFCEVAPTSGGETPILLSHIVYERMRQKFPEFVEKLEKHGLIYTYLLGEDDDLSYPGGRGWKSTFSTADKSVAEERATKMDIKLEWMEDGGVKRITGPLPVIRYDKSRQRKIWFTNMVGWEVAGNAPYKTITFGDSKPLPADICYECLKIFEEECVAIPWKKGDVLLIDNWAVLHARRPTNSPRRVLDSLCK